MIMNDEHEDFFKKKKKKTHDLFNPSPGNRLIVCFAVGQYILCRFYIYVLLPVYIHLNYHK